VVAACAAFDYAEQIQTWCVVEQMTVDRNADLANTKRFGVIVRSNEVRMYLWPAFGMVCPHHLLVAVPLCKNDHDPSKCNRCPRQISKN
jgi:hypothetical protein